MKQLKFQAHGEIVQEWKTVGAGMEDNGRGLVWENGNLVRKAPRKKGGLIE